MRARRASLASLSVGIPRGRTSPLTLTQGGASPPPHWGSLPTQVGNRPPVELQRAGEKHPGLSMDLATHGPRAWQEAPGCDRGQACYCRRTREGTTKK